MMPDSEDPQPPKGIEEERKVEQATELDDEEYHARADEYMEAMHEKAEAIQEASADVEVEYSVRLIIFNLAEDARNG